VYRLITQHQARLDNARRAKKAKESQTDFVGGQFFGREKEAKRKEKKKRGSISERDVI